MTAPIERGPCIRTALFLATVVLLFVALGWPFARRLGIEVDEAMVTAGIYEGSAPWYSWKAGGVEIPVMLLPYLGALKTWILNAVFLVWPPANISLRLPSIVISAASIVLFFALLQRLAGARAAWAGAALLATDPSFVLSSAIDFGPVAIQIALKLAGMLLLVLFHRKPALWKLWLGAFAFGLAMWDKALFVWTLAGFVCAAPVAWRELRPHLTRRNAAIAACAFLLGALPLVVYNIERPLETFRTTVRLAPDNPHIKLILLSRTFDGSAVFGFFTAPDIGPNPGKPHTLLGRAAFAIARATGEPWRTLTPWALGVAMLVGWRVRLTRFCLLAMAVTWLLMFLTTGAGGAVHHVVLLWPLGWMLVAVAFSRLDLRVFVGLTTVLTISNLLVMNSYHVELARNGTGDRWTDAMPSLVDFVKRSNAPQIVAADWGILETLVLLTQGELPAEDVSAAMRDPSMLPRVDAAVSNPAALFITHTATHEQWQGARAMVISRAATRGLAAEPVTTISDRSGRPIFDLFRFRRAR